MGCATRLQLHGSDIFWTENERIAKKPLAGGAATTIVTGIAADEYGWYAEKSPPFATDGTNLFVGQKNRIKQFAIGKESKVLVDLPEGLRDLTADGSYVYWLSSILSKVYKVPVTEGLRYFLPGHPWMAVAGYEFIKAMSTGCPIPTPSFILTTSLKKSPRMAARSLPSPRISLAG